MNDHGYNIPPFTPSQLHNRDLIRIIAIDFSDRRQINDEANYDYAEHNGNYNGLSNLPNQEMANDLVVQALQNPYYATDDDIPMENTTQDNCNDNIDRITSVRNIYYDE